MPKELELGSPLDKHPHSRPEYYTANNTMATENEVILGLGGLIRMLQPEIVVETGTHEGAATMVMAQALVENGHGHLWTIESNARYDAVAEVRLSPFTNITRLKGDARRFPLNVLRGPIDFAFLDAGERTRPEELIHLAKKARAGTVFAIHDTHVHRKFTYTPVLDLGGLLAGMKFRHVELPTPRGLALLVLGEA